MELNHRRWGEGEALLLIHGIGHCWQGWLPVVEHLSGHEVIAIDLPGFGESPMPPPGTPAGVESLTTLVSDFLDRHGLGQVHVAGNSLGGWIALELAKRGRARTATGLSPAGFHNRIEAVFQRSSFVLLRGASRLVDDRALHLFARRRLRQLAFGQQVVHPERVPVVPTIPALARAPWFDDTLRAINGRSFSGGEEIEAPVTIAWGEHDHVLLPHQAKRAAQRIPSARLVTLRGCGHVPFYDDPVQVAQTVMESAARGQ